MLKSKVKVPGTQVGVLVELDDSGRSAVLEIVKGQERWSIFALTGEGFNDKGRAVLTGKAGSIEARLDVTRGDQLTTGKLVLPIPELGQIGAQLGVALRFTQTAQDAGALDFNEDGKVNEADLKAYAKKHPIITGAVGVGGAAVVYKAVKALWRML